MEALAAASDELAGVAEWFVLSGSVPAGIPDDVYAALTARLKRRGRTVLLDASGRPFAAALVAAPDITKPNIQSDATGERSSPAS